MNETGEMNSLVTLLSRKTLTVDGVTDILSFDESFLTVQTVLGRLNVDGAELRMDALSLDTGTVTLEGRIDGIWYSSDNERKKRGLFGKK